MRYAALSLALLGACASATSGRPQDMGGPDLLPVASDALPSGAILFFKKLACPPGWSVYAPARGRFIVPGGGSPDGGVGGVGGTVGAALSSAGDDPTHDHALDGGVAIDSTSYVLVAGEGNHGLGVAGTPPLQLAAAASSSGLPYVQLLICQRHGAAQPASTPPAGMVAFFDGDSCPATWHEYTALSGRHLVGLPGGAMPGGFGGQPLMPGEDRGHSHGVSGTINTNSYGVAGLSGCCAGGYAKNGSYNFMLTSSASSVGLPYIQLRACLKD